jgi:hypothetical protein
MVAAFILADSELETTRAANPGTAAAPLLNCPDIDGIAPVGLFTDIFPVADLYGADSNDTGLGEPDGYHPLYDAKDANGTIDLFEDIFYVAESFGDTCPLVDLQVAKATAWGIANLPKVDDVAGRAALQALGYYQGSSDVPGQGIHYVNVEIWDGTFDPQAPEGVVYNNGKLAAQLYVVDGGGVGGAGGVGWGTYEATACCPGAEHDIDLEVAADGPQCSPACSWAGGEGWHVHHYLCTANIGTTSAIAIPAALAPSLADTKAHCQSFSGGDPECTVPITVTNCFRWAKNVGWMGHLWNHELNPNQIADTGGNNGRFSDCVPDGSMWKAFTCPA